MLHRKKVLLILDDVDKQDQLHALVGHPDWFGDGSRIVVTTRDRQLLVSHGVETRYELDVLTENEALELLCWKAFKTNKVGKGYEEILKRSVLYASCLPLALELIGSTLCGKSIEEWKSAIDEFEVIPPKEIQKILKISFDALEEKEQQIFLDIACFFKGYELLEVEDILSAHYGVSVKYHIRVLVDKCLIKIEPFPKTVKLHDLIEDMGKEIVKQESPQDAGERNRLWLHQDIIHVLEENKGSRKIQIMILNFPYFEEGVVDWDGKALEKMENLKTLIIRNAFFL
ncbi:hypothetical protein TanjilG_33013 [Lupinus angustifolius]|uniref:Uncharacterized protein n=1 Tax=Lupinus angustifolius TaxID=3871 RepID=A0A4P1RNZ6_LUPAN|nr:hypothetical protein TanjilG_33013 [Lupinus angustifolius]